MLRTMILALALAAPGLAAAEQFPESALNAEIRSDTGEVIGHVRAVERDRSGRIVAVEAPGLEPADAPTAARDLLAQNERPLRQVAHRARQAEAGGDALVHMR